MTTSDKRKVWLLAAAAVLLSGGGLLAVRRMRQGAHGAGAHAVLYHCPMHPSYVSDRPGDCPICNMKLVPKEEPAAGPARGGKPLFYRNPMRPDVTSPVPRKDEMGMDYVPVYPGEDKVSLPVPGQASVIVPPESRRLIGMKVEPARRRDLSFTVRASGRVAYDPDLYNAIAEYREAVKARERVAASPWPDVHERAEALVRSAILRLRQMGLSEAQIQDSSDARRQDTSLLLGGSGSVWVYAQIYEYEIGNIRPGQSAAITTPAYPGRTFQGTLKSVDPILSSETRSLKVRIEVPNPDGLLKLEMFVNAAIRVELGRVLALPEEAVVDTGQRTIVFVDEGGGRLDPREVRLGQEADGYHEVLSGLREGEKVVTSANFLVDSESRLKAAVAGASK